MSARISYDNAAVALGTVSIASLVSLVLTGDLRFAVIQGAAIGVALVLGALAIVAGLAALPWLAAVTGAAFVAAAILQVVLVTLRVTWLDGNTSAAALWLGLGVGLLVLARAPRRATVPTSSAPLPPEETR